MKPEAAPDPSQAGRLVPRADLEGRVDPFLLKRMDPRRQEFVVREVTPGLTWNRLDLAIKLFYLEQSQADRCAFAQELYDAHIHAFSLGDFREPGNESKSDAASFRSAFRDILDGLRRTGFDPERSLIPAASDGSFINGGHRAACAMFLGHKVHVVETGLPPVCYDHRFFRSRGMDEDLLEAAVVKYAERNPRARVALVWSGDASPSRIEAHLGPRVYAKRVSLSPRGLANLLATMGLELQIPEAPGPKARPMLHVFERDDRTKGAAWEATLRDLTKEDRHLLHIPASREESLDLTRCLLNERSLRFLNVGAPDRFPTTASLARTFRAALDLAGVLREEAILGPAMVLAAFGAREATAADYMSPIPIHAGATAPLPSPEDIGDILQDPRRHFHAWGLRFLSVGEALEVLRRNPVPAEDDLRLLAQLLPAAEPRHPARRIANAARLLQSRVRRTAIRAVLRLGLREQALSLYRALRRGRR